MIDIEVTGMMRIDYRRAKAIEELFDDFDNVEQRNFIEPIVGKVFDRH